MQQKDLNYQRSKFTFFKTILCDFCFVKDNNEKIHTIALTQL